MFSSSLTTKATQTNTLTEANKHTSALTLRKCCKPAITQQYLPNPSLTPRCAKWTTVQTLKCCRCMRTLLVLCWTSPTNTLNAFINNSCFVLAAYSRFHFMPRPSLHFVGRNAKHFLCGRVHAKPVRKGIRNAIVRHAISLHSYAKFYWTVC